MRIASYNLFEGALDTYPLLKEFVIDQGVDVLSVQEANSWQDGNPNKLDDFAQSTGLTNYAFGNSNTRYKLATFSRLPLITSTTHTEGYWHCAVQTTIPIEGNDVDIWNVHLNPKDEDSRLAEARLIATAAQPALIMGDLNSLSKVDGYSTELISELAKRGIKKFGEKALRYDVIDHFNRDGFVDIATALNKRATTVPTPANKDMFHAADMRLDYIFASRSLMAAIKDISVVKDSLTDQISDHYPIVLTLE